MKTNQIKLEIKKQQKLLDKLLFENDDEADKIFNKIERLKHRLELLQEESNE